MTVCGQRWKTAIADAMSASRRFPTAAHSPWKTLCVSHIPTAPTIVLVSLPKPKNERTQPPGLATSVQAHPSMRICYPQPALEILKDAEKIAPAGPA